MVQQGSNGDQFRARAGTLTLSFLTSAEPPEVLLELMQRAFQGGLMDPVEDEAERAELQEQYDAELEARMLEEEAAELDEEDAFELDARTEIPELGEPADDRPEPEYRPSPKGVQLVYVASLLQRWLHNCPSGPLEIGVSGSDAIASLICCWSATVIHALAQGPLTAAEVHHAVDPIPEIETVEEHLRAMQSAGHVTKIDAGDETRYALTDWMREGIAPIAAAARTELHYPESGMAPPDVLDVEAAFQLALPLLHLPPDMRGSCRLGVQIPGGRPLMAGASIEVDRGAVVRSSTLLEEDPETFATGSPRAWLDTLVDPGSGRIAVGGDARIVDAVLGELHETLFSPIPK